MIQAQDFKAVQAIRPAVIDNTAATMIAVDTTGFDYCTFIVTVGATDVASTVLKVTECSTTGGTYSDVTGLIGGTSETIANAASTQLDTTDGVVLMFDVNCQLVEQFLKMNITAGNGTNGIAMACVALLSRANDGHSPSTIAERGCSQILRIPDATA